MFATVARGLEPNTQAIRYYERIGLLPESGRTESGYRSYAEDERRLRSIENARRAEFARDIGVCTLSSYSSTSSSSARTTRFGVMSPSFSCVSEPCKLTMFLPSNGSSTHRSSGWTIRISKIS